MAYLVKPQKSYYVDAAGKRVPKGTPGSRRVNERHSKWYGVGIPGFPPKKRVPLAADKTAARRMLDDLVRRGEQGQAGLPDRDAGRQKLADLLEAFRADLSLGLASRSRKRVKRPPSTAQVSLIVQRVRDLLDGAGFAYPVDMDDAAPGKIAGHLQARIGRPRKAGGLSHQSAAFFLAALRRFVWWLAQRKRIPVRADLFDDVPGFEPDANRIHARRAVTPAELARILEITLTSSWTFRGLTGRDRYHVYLIAFATGFRAGEIAALTPANFDLGGETPVVRLSGKRTKNRKDAIIPLPPAVAVQLRAFIDGRDAGKPVWPGNWRFKGAMMLRGDLKSAGVPYVIGGPSGKEYADFHALRHSFVTALAAAGVGPKELQELARHSDPRLTLGLYSHTTIEQKAAAVGRLSLPGQESVGSPFAGLTRDHLETLTAGLLGMFGIAFGAGVDTPRDTPSPGIPGDNPGRSETGQSDSAAA